MVHTTKATKHKYELEEDSLYNKHWRNNKGEIDGEITPRYISRSRSPRGEEIQD